MRLRASAMLLLCLRPAAATSGQKACDSSDSSGDGRAGRRSSIVRFRTFSDLTSEEELMVAFSEVRRLTESIESKRQQLVGRLGMVVPSLSKNSSYGECMADHCKMLECIATLQERFFAALAGSGLYPLLDAEAKDEVLAASPEEFRERCRYDDSYRALRDRISFCERADEASCDAELQRYRATEEHYATVQALLAMLLGEPSTSALYESYCDDWRSLCCGKRRDSYRLEN